MKIFHGLPNAENRVPCALTIGNFDGVHRGHQELLAYVRVAASACGLPVCVMIFEPHPCEFFNPMGAPPRIAMLRDKLEVLSAHGVDRVIIMRFNRAFANQLPSVFIEQIIVDGLHAQWVIVGDDFHYGVKRAGDYSSLKTAGIYYDFKVRRIHTVVDSSGARISSSGVRSALIVGDFDAACSALGHAYTIGGHVVHGLSLGRNLGFPTLNLLIPHKRLAISGIFAVRVHGLEGRPLPGVANLGQRPTVDNSGRLLLEIHLLNWHGNAYGTLVRVEFLKKLRNEEKFVDLETLSIAIARDVANTHAWFVASRNRCVRQLHY